MAGKIQNEDIKSVSELTGAGATAASLPNDDKIYVTASGINKTLKQAIIDGDIGGTGLTDPMTTNGDMIYRAAGVPARLAAGSNGEVLTLAAGLPSWAAGGGGGALTDRSFNNQTGTTYTFALTDAVKNSNKLVTFSNAAAQTITIPTNASVAFPVGSQIDCVQLGVGFVSFTPEVGVTINSPHAATGIMAQYASATLIKTATDTWDLFGDLIDPIVATGGTGPTTDGDFKYHVFNSSSTFQITSGRGVVQYLVIAGGGGGGGNIGGGGGAGGYRAGSLTMGVGSYTVTVGGGGAGGVNEASGVNGSNSVFDTITSTGGGCGAARTAGNQTTVGNGGSGGAGAGSVSGSLAGGTGTVGQGNNGGTGNNAGGSFAGAGGGSSSAIGGNAASGGVGGVGGAGTSSSITGSAVTRGAGGGGGSNNGTGGGGAGGTGGGGAGNGSGGNGVAGTVNTGSGGGGGSNSQTGGAGGSGVVIVRYQF